MGELFTSGIGLLSLFTIGFCVVMCIFFVIYFSKKMDEDSRDKG